MEPEEIAGEEISHSGPRDVRFGLLDIGSSRPRIFSFTVEGGFTVVEGDIVFGVAEESAAENRSTGSPEPPTTEANAIRARNTWPGGRVPFDIDASIADQFAIRQAIQAWEAATDLVFTERTPANAAQTSDWVRFILSSDGCNSPLGRQGGMQLVNLSRGCAGDSVSIMHEIGHAVGLHHEHQRNDRNFFVRINRDNITPGMEFAFDLEAMADDFGNYDYSSIMHYSSTAFGRVLDGVTQVTIEPLRNTGGVTPGTALALSAGDVEAVAALYGCPIVFRDIRILRERLTILDQRLSRATGATERQEILKEKRAVQREVDKEKRKGQDLGCTAFEWYNRGLASPL